MIPIQLKWVVLLVLGGLFCASAGFSATDNFGEPLRDEICQRLDNNLPQNLPKDKITQTETTNAFDSVCGLGGESLPCRQRICNTCVDAGVTSACDPDQFQTSK